MQVNLDDMEAGMYAGEDKIVIAKAAVYDKETLRLDFIKENESEPTEQELLEFAMENAEADLACDWGHICSKKDLFVLNFSE